MAVNISPTWALRLERLLMPLPVHSVPSLASMSIQINIANNFAGLALDVAADVRSFRDIFRETLQNPTLPNLNTALLRAAAIGHTNGVIIALEKGANVNLADDGLGHTALMHAANSGQRETAALLIERWADVNWLDEDGKTALMLAAGGGHRDIAALLIESGGDVNWENSKGKTALMFAALGG